MSEATKESSPMVPATSDAIKGEAEDDYILELTKEYEFEGQKIKQIDFIGMEDLTANDMIQANKVLISQGVVTPLPEMDMGYVMFIAAQATKLPIEFYKQLKPRDAVKVKNKVTNFFYGEE